MKFDSTYQPTTVAGAFQPMLSRKIAQNATSPEIGQPILLCILAAAFAHREIS